MQIDRSSFSEKKSFLLRIELIESLWTLREAFSKEFNKREAHKCGFKIQQFCSYSILVSCMLMYEFSRDSISSACSIISVWNIRRIRPIRREGKKNKSYDVKHSYYYVILATHLKPKCHITVHTCFTKAKYSYASLLWSHDQNAAITSCQANIC